MSLMYGIVRVYGAAGHGKGVVDAMSVFGVKTLLRTAIIKTDANFSNSMAIVDFFVQSKRRR